VKQPKRIAILQLARFGDLIQTSPLILRHRQNHPESEITLIVDERVQPVAEMLSGVDEVITLNLTSTPWQQKTPLTIKLSASQQWLSTVDQFEPYDLLYILNQDPFSGAIAECIPARERVGPRLRQILPAPHRFLTVGVQDRQYNPVHLSEIWAAYASGSSRIPCPAIRNNVLGTGFALPRGSKYVSSMKIKRIAINLGAKAAGRRPPWEKLAELADRLISNSSVEIVLLGMSVDQADASKLIQLLSEAYRENVIDLTGKTRLIDLPGVLAACDVLISGDTGTLQLAAATGTKCIGLFMAGANPVETGPYMDGAVAIVRRNTLEFSEQQIDDLHDLPIDKIVELATRLAQGDEIKERMLDANHAFAVLVARSDHLGISYTPLAEEDGIQLGKGKRWLPYLRFLLHKAERRAGDETSTDRRIRVLSKNQFDVLKRLLDHPDSVSTGEERWLGTIVQAFQRETAGLVNTVNREAKVAQQD